VPLIHLECNLLNFDERDTGKDAKASIRSILSRAWILYLIVPHCSDAKVHERAQPLDRRHRENLQNSRGDFIERRAIMVHCPECESDLDIEEDEVDEGEIVSCPECGTDFEIVTTSPLELKSVEEEEYDEDEDEEEESDVGDFS
jgi:alpha-aminoadipate carrier protein LysW